MTMLSANEIAAIYEQTYGIKASDRAIRVLTTAINLGDLLWDMGSRDAQDGQPPQTFSDFEALARTSTQKNASVDQECAHEIALLWYDCYMDAYNEQRKSAR